MDIKEKDEALKLQAIIKSASDGIIIINEEGLIELINDAACNLFNYSANDLIGKNISMLMEHQHASHHNRYLKNYLKTGIKKIIGIGREVGGKKSDGSVFPVRLSISEAQLHDRVVFTGIIHDLTQEKKAAEALKSEKEKAQMYFDLANTITVVLDHAGVIQLANKKGIEILGYTEKELLGKYWWDFFALDSEKAESFKKVFANGYHSEFDFFENELIAKSGQTIIVSWRNAPILNKSKNLTGLICSGVDITQQRKIENRILELNSELEERVDERTEELADAVNQLLEINKQLQHEIKERKTAENNLRKAFKKEKDLNELKSRFVSMASHEFRTPLSTILSSADLIEAYQQPEQQEKREKHINRIKSSVTNLTSILNDFLSLSKLEEGQTAIKINEIEIIDFFVQVIDEIKTQLKPGQRIIFHPEPLSHTIFSTDKGILKNILFNLTSNAIKYSSTKGEIQIKVALNQKNLEVSVVDNGIGIPIEEQAFLFTRFFRAHNAENIQGTGLGLNIVKRYIEILKGTLHFESQENVGSTFSFKIPSLEL
jgi:two-component system sensor kinase FixL